LKEEISDCDEVASGVTTTATSGMSPLKHWQGRFRYPVPSVPARASSLSHLLLMALLGEVAEDFEVGDFVVKDDGENSEKGGEVVCHLEEGGLDGGAVGAGDTAQGGVEALGWASVGG
jgi:hypothetical protein